MRKPALLALLGLLAAALVAATVALAARGGAPAAKTTLPRAVARTAAAPSLGFQLAARIQSAGVVPMILHASGATSPTARRVHLKVEDVVAPDGTRLTGPSADEKVDGRFLYVRSSATRTTFGPLWVREALAALDSASTELKTLRAVSPDGLLAAAARARGVRPGPEAGVFHAWLPYRDPLVRAALAGVEGGIEYRHLRLTTWVGATGYVRLLLLTGRTPDGRSRLLLTLSLTDVGRRVAVGPPKAGSFVDFQLDTLRE
jgi:hypothetical protein